MQFSEMCLRFRIFIQKYVFFYEFYVLSGPETTVLRSPHVLGLNLLKKLGFNKKRKNFIENVPNAPQTTSFFEMCVTEPEI